MFYFSLLSCKHVKRVNVYSVSVSAAGSNIRLWQVHKTEMCCTNLLKINLNHQSILQNESLLRFLNALSGHAESLA